MSAVIVSVYKNKDKACVQCDATLKKLGQLKIDHRLVAYTEGDEDHLYVTQELGLSAAPGVVVTVDGRVHDSWGGNRPDRITDIQVLLRDPDQEDEAA
jgi:thioredoxin-like negative regulator of GroEL